MRLHQIASGVIPLNAAHAIIEKNAKREPALEISASALSEAGMLIIFQET